MTTLTILFWVCAFLVFYTYLGYGMLLWLLVRIREAVRPARTAPYPLQDGGQAAGRQNAPEGVRHDVQATKGMQAEERFDKTSDGLPASDALQPAADVTSASEELPEATLLIAAYNEQDVVAAKMENCLSLEYPAGRLHIVWVTDGSTDRTCELLAAWPEATVLHDPRRAGKTAALNRAMERIETPIVIFTDANTMLNPEAVRRIVACFADPRVGCVAGEKRVMASGREGAAATEGVYWKYESKLKELDYRLYSAVGAAGELFAVRRELFERLPEDTLLDDFICSMRIAAKGYRIAYCREAYALETPSADMAEESKRKRRIAAGGLQSVWRLRGLLNPFRHGVLAFQYISHRVLRWTLAPAALAALPPLNIALLWSAYPKFYAVLLGFQTLFWIAAAAGWLRERSGRGGGLLAVPYYFLFMNLNVFRGARYLAVHRGYGAWEKARRAG